MTAGERLRVPASTAALPRAECPPPPLAARGVPRSGILPRLARQGGPTVHRAGARSRRVRANLILGPPDPLLRHPGDERRRLPLVAGGPAVIVVIASDALDGYWRDGGSQRPARWSTSPARVVEQCCWIVFAHLGADRRLGPLLVVTRGIAVGAARHGAGRTAFGPKTTLPVTEWLTASRFMREFYGTRARRSSSSVRRARLPGAEFDPRSPPVAGRRLGWFFVYGSLVLTVARGLPVVFDASISGAAGRGGGRRRSTSRGAWHDRYAPPAPLAVPTCRRPTSRPRHGGGLRRGQHPAARHVLRAAVALSDPARRHFGPRAAAGTCWRWCATPDSAAPAPSCASSGPTSAAGRWRCSPRWRRRRSRR